MYILHIVTTLKNNADKSPEGKMKFKSMRYK